MSKHIFNKPYIIWAIINLSKNSFSNSADKKLSLIKKIARALNEGADILDIGAESTAPSSQAICAKSELSLLLPALKKIIKYRHDNKLDFLISVDTYKSEVAKEVLAIGVDIINDISGFSFDAKMLDVLLEYKPIYVLGYSADKYENMHIINENSDIVDNMLIYFASKLNILKNSNFPMENIVLDPCLGFAKTTKQNLQILENIAKLKKLDKKILMALSRKRMFKDLFDLDISDRDNVTATTSALLFAQGIKQHRVHNVLATKHALDLAKLLNK